MAKTRSNPIAPGARVEGHVTFIVPDISVEMLRGGGTAWRLSFQDVNGRQMAALCFANAFASPSHKEKDFSGSITSVETADIDFTTLIMLVDGNGTGRASHLGQFTYTFEFVVDLGTFLGVGSAEFTAANGDSFTTEITATAVVETPIVNRVVEQHTIAGGTGRFEAASGSFTLERLVTATSANNVSVGTVDGTIVTSKSK